MSVQVEPHEVLAYLNRMGFCHVSADQLKAFIKDLKKLIKHDLKQCKCAHSKSPEVSSTAVRETDTSFYESSTCCYRRKSESDAHSSSTLDGDETDNSCSSKEDHKSDSKENLKQTAELKSSAKDKQSRIQKVIERPRSSFIKPWQLQTTAPQRRNDPVALYHKYQSLWQQQKIPGNDNRVGLRWNVREKMLGVDPHPRPVNRSSSVERIARHKHGFCS